ncbi:MAG: murein hydrolase activator EnvC family protein [Acutalibacteraceae bacterium]|nr:peptidoglycan DD-metalloendopeptidase family protein [Clostridiales bacterium]
MTKNCQKTGKRTLLRGVAFVSALVLLTALPAGFSQMRVRAADTDALEDQLNDLRNQSQQLQQEINSLSGDLDAAQERLNLQKRQADNARELYQKLSQQMEQLNAQIGEKEEEIAAKEQEIADREADIADRKELLKKRLQAISKSGNLTAFQMLFNTESYADYLIKSKMMERSSEQDKALMDELEVEIAGIQKEREELEADRKSLDDDKAALEPLRQEAEDNARRLEQVCKEIERDEMTLAEKVADAKRKQEALDAEAAKVQELLDQSNYEGKYSKMYWPVPAVKNISSGFGYRWGSMHKGIDISEGAVPVYGQSIYAAADGVVLYTVTSGWGGGFGLHVVIDHGYDANGKRISTRYAHCSQVLVSPGQVVKGGETIIGKVGDTGDVTGPHLHFEVMEGGVLDQVDPVANGYVPNYRNGVIVG